MYQGVILARGSTALELYEQTQTGSQEQRQAAQSKLKAHMQELNQKYRKMHGVDPMPAWRIGDQPVAE